jgi:hypothetical protein
MVPRRRHAGRSRQAAHQPPRSGTPSVAEITAYGALAALVAAALLVVNDEPLWLAAAVLAGSTGMIGILAVAASRMRRFPPEAESDPAPTASPESGASTESSDSPRKRRSSGRRKPGSRSADEHHPSTPEATSPDGHDGGTTGSARHAGGHRRRRKR